MKSDGAVPVLIGEVPGRDAIDDNVGVIREDKKVTSGPSVAQLSVKDRLFPRIIFESYWCRSRTGGFPDKTCLAVVDTAARAQRLARSQLSAGVFDHPPRRCTSSCLTVRAGWSNIIIVRYPRRQSRYWPAARNRSCQETGHQPRCADKTARETNLAHGIAALLSSTAPLPSTR